MKIIKKIKEKKGFVILFAVTLSAIILSIALGVSNIATKELKFSTSAKDTNNAFFAADTGVEQVLYNDIKGGLYPTAGTSTLIISGLGSDNVSCSVVTITKEDTGGPLKTSIVSKGYNTGDASCNSTNLDRIERELDVNY